MTDHIDAPKAELLPCPFCGGEASDAGLIRYNEAAALDIGDGKQIEYFYCNCVRCGVSNAGLAGHASKEEAIAAWNRRASYAETVAPYVAAQRMVREAIGELFGPLASIESDEAVLRRGPEPKHEAEAQIAALRRVAQEREAVGVAIKLGRFDHHPDPVIDFEIEVQSLEARLFDAKRGISKPGTVPETVAEVHADIERALIFRVGGDPSAVSAKQTLRRLDEEARQALRPPVEAQPAKGVRVAERIYQAMQDAWADNPNAGVFDVLQHALSTLEPTAPQEEGEYVRFTLMVRNSHIDFGGAYCSDDRTITLDGWSITMRKLASPPVPAIGVSEEKRGIYIASKTKHADRWRFLRDKVGEPIISTWIDEAGPGESGDLGDLWRRCIHEAAHAEVLILYREPDEVLKGGWIELGAALASGVKVFAVGIEEFTVSHDPRIEHLPDMKSAVAASRAYLDAISPSRER